MCIANNWDSETDADNCKVRKVLYNFEMKSDGIVEDHAYIGKSGSACFQQGGGVFVVVKAGGTDKSIAFNKVVIAAGKGVPFWTLLLIISAFLPRCIPFEEFDLSNYTTYNNSYNATFLQN